MPVGSPSYSVLTANFCGTQKKRWGMLRSIIICLLGLALLAPMANAEEKTINLIVLTAVNFEPCLPSLAFKAKGGTL
jgi:hypothetical protein